MTEQALLHFWEHEAERLQRTVAQLEAEVEDLGKSCVKLQEERDALRAEVERLRKREDDSPFDYVPFSDPLPPSAAEVESLLEEVNDDEQV